MIKLELSRDSIRTDNHPQQKFSVIRLIFQEIFPMSDQTICFRKRGMIIGQDLGCFEVGLGWKGSTIFHLPITPPWHCW